MEKRRRRRKSRWGRRGGGGGKIVMREMGKDSYCDEGNVVDMVK